MPTEEVDGASEDDVLDTAVESWLVDCAAGLNVFEADENDGPNAMVDADMLSDAVILEPVAEKDEDNDEDADTEAFGPTSVA